MQGTPAQVFGNRGALKKTNLETPAVLELFESLCKKGILKASLPLPRNLKTLETYISDINLNPHYGGNNIVTENRKKAILAIFMMAFLIIIGFVFPSIWKSQKGNKKSETENTQHDNNENAETEQAENNESISFQDFEALEDFFSKEQVKLFQEELTSYLKNVKQMSLTSIRFLADDTTYPNASDINFLFQLPDKSVLPVYYTSSTGRFFFGEERTPDSGKEIIYERPTDDKLPSITTEEIEQLQEGGYDDTSVNSEKAAPVTEVPETPSMEEPKEVQP